MDENNIGGICVEPCKHDKDFERHEDRILKLEEWRSTQTAESAKTEVYMKNVIAGQDDIKLSVKEIQTELKTLTKESGSDEILIEVLGSLKTVLTTMSAPEPKETKSLQQVLVTEAIGLAKWAVIIAAALSGVKLIS